MANFNYDGSYPLDRVTMKGYTFRQCTIRNWTPHNQQVACRRRCYYLVRQLPGGAVKKDFYYRLNLLVLPKDDDLVELELKVALANGGY